MIRTRSRKRGATIAVAAGLAAIAALAGCSTSESSTPRASDLPGLAHVHGLGINPSDGRLYAASHLGVFRVSDGRARRMGGLVQDTMGFTVAGPDRFLASGHPDLLEDEILDPGMRPLLGLIESRDRAVSWRGRSLQGEVDFHALAFGHGTVYGYDATGGRLLVSEDLLSWDARSGVPLSSIAVSPTSPDRLVATGESGLLATTDRGRTWAAVPGAPPLVLVSWDPRAGLWGLTIDGSVYEGSDDGATWTARGTIGAIPAAFLADSSGLYAATDTSILTSSDGGRTWAPLTAIGS